MLDGLQIVAMGGALEGADRTSRETLLWNADRRHPDQIIHTVKEAKGEHEADKLS